MNSLLSTFRSGPTRKLCSSDVSSAQNDVRASALRAFPVCAHQHVIYVPPHDSEVHRIKEGQRCADRAAWRGSLQRVRAGEVRNGGAWRIGSEVDAGAREWRGATSSGGALNSSAAYLSLQVLVPTSNHDCISSLHVSDLS